MQTPGVRDMSFDDVYVANKNWYDWSFESLKAVTFW